MKTIKVIVPISVITMALLSFNTFATVKCSGFSGCERKYCEIEQQLINAQSTNNQHRIDGLTSALAAAKSNCSNHDLKQDLMRKIEESQEEIADYNEDLQQAIKNSKEGKVAKYQDKIQQEADKLQRLSRELSELN